MGRAERTPSRSRRGDDGYRDVHAIRPDDVPVDDDGSSPSVEPADAGASRLMDRDRSWLEFNRRVLELSLDDRTPLLERVKFLAIFGSNLDEFVMKRVARLRRQHEATGSGGARLEAVRSLIRELEDQQLACWLDGVRPALESHGIRPIAWSDLDASESARMRDWFTQEIFPVLTPLAVDPSHRFPFISNLSQSLGVLLTGPGSDRQLFARVKIPHKLKQLVRVETVLGESEVPDGQGRFIPLLSVIRENLDELFPGMTIAEVVAFRLTRDADVTVADDDAENLLELVESQLRRRRFARPVRLQVGAGASDVMIGHLLEDIDLAPDDIDPGEGPLDWASLFELTSLPRPELGCEPWSPVVPARLTDPDKNIFEVIREGDILVHHPYESFEASTLRLIQSASRDPDVLAIKLTIYRTSRDSPFISSLIRAAEHGKQVACLVELRARFDEDRNVRLARRLERAGVHVAYGVADLKTHCKAALVVRREPDGIRCYAHIGTGNYHPATAHQYTDVGILTCDPAITRDAVGLFNLLTGRSLQESYDRLLVAPATMKTRFLEMIDREIEIAQRHARGESEANGRVWAKMNALGDPDIIERLYQASGAGADVFLVIRGFCCLRPGVPGLSENIQVVSVLGRFLEHSRIFHFGAGKVDPVDGEWYISAADWRTRNLMLRVEAACPINDLEARAKLVRLFDVHRRDQRNAWDILPDGTGQLRYPDGSAEPDSPEAMGTFATLMLDALEWR